MSKQFTAGQRIVCEKTLTMEGGESAFTEGKVYLVSKVTGRGNVCVVRSDVLPDHWLGLDEEDEPSWSNYFCAADEAAP